MKAVDFYNMIKELNQISQEGYMNIPASIEVISVFTILKHRKNYIKTLENLSRESEINPEFFSKPFYFPFSQNQLKILKDNCHAWKQQHDKSSKSENAIIEEKLINLYEKILKKQTELQIQIEANLKSHFFSALQHRIAGIDQALKAIDKKIKNLIDDSKTLSQPDSDDEEDDYSSNNILRIKLDALATLREQLQEVRNQYQQALDQSDSILEAEEVLSPVKVENFLFTTEKDVMSSLREAKESISSHGSQLHTNPLTKFISEIYEAITCGFGHKATATEEVISKAQENINISFN